jgi:hypothetical protein
VFGSSLVRRSALNRLRLRKSRSYSAGSTPPNPAEDKKSYFAALDYRGSLKPINHLSEDELISIRCSFAQTERTSAIFAVAGSLFRGDYFEFGCLNLSTFITTINACRINDIVGLTGDVKTFYGFDIFGETKPQSAETLQRYKGSESYFSDFSNPASLETYYAKLKANGVYVDRCRLIKGYFDETFTSDFVAEYLKAGRRAGFVYIDCNIPTSYEAVFRHLAEILADDAWIYLDEYLEQSGVTVLFESFRDTLSRERNLGTVFARSAGGWGALFRCYKR